MSYYPPSGSGPTPTRPAGSSPDRIPTVVTAVIGVLALIGVLLVGLLTDDKISAGANPGGPISSVPGDSGGGSVDSGGGSSSGGSSSGGAATAVPVPTPTDFPASTAPAGGESTASGGGAAGAFSFPLPPNTTPITSYGSLKPAPEEKWYLTSTGLAAANTFYTTKFKAEGGVTYISPLVQKDDSGKVTGYFTIWHFDDTTVEVSLDENYLGLKPGYVLIQSDVTT